MWAHASPQAGYAARRDARARVRATCSPSVRRRRPSRRSACSTATVSQLMLRPDVTLPVARLVSTRLPRRRPGRFACATAAPVFCRARLRCAARARQFTQLGIELIGHAGSEADAEVLLPGGGGARRRPASADYVVVARGACGLSTTLLELSGAPDGVGAAQVRMAVSARCDFVALDELVGAGGRRRAEPGGLRALLSLPRIHGGAGAIGGRARSARALRRIARRRGGRLVRLGPRRARRAARRALGAVSPGRVTVDFSAHGLVWLLHRHGLRACTGRGLGTCLGSGGRYDRVFERYGSPRPAAGFALSLEAVQAALGGTDAAARAGASAPCASPCPKGPCSTARSTLLARLPAWTSRALRDAGRQLIVRSADDAVEYVIVRPTDAPVLRGVRRRRLRHLRPGLAGRGGPRRPRSSSDLRYGGCRFVVAEPDGARRPHRARATGASARIRVATQVPAHRPGATSPTHRRRGRRSQVPRQHRARAARGHGRPASSTSPPPAPRCARTTSWSSTRSWRARHASSPIRRAARTDPRVFGLAQPACGRRDMTGRSRRRDAVPAGPRTTSTCSSQSAGSSARAKGRPSMKTIVLAARRASHRRDARARRGRCPPTSSRRPRRSSSGRARRGRRGPARVRTDASTASSFRRFRVPAEVHRRRQSTRWARSSSPGVLARPRDQIRDFHEREVQQSWFMAWPDGTILGQKVTPLDSVGIYVPGGRAQYPSTVLMNAVPAKVAGRGAHRHGHPAPGRRRRPVPLHAVRRKPCRAWTRSTPLGGAQAVAALAYGTESVPRVDKITGPGNAYVAAAKRLVSGDCGHRHGGRPQRGVRPGGLHGRPAPGGDRPHGAGRARPASRRAYLVTCDPGLPAMSCSATSRSTSRSRPGAEITAPVPRQQGRRRGVPGPGARPWTP